MTGDAAVLPLVGKKLMSKLGGMANESAAAEVSDFARRQMEKMGWSAGKGLGKNEQGVKSHVKVKRREELQGVGAEKQEVKEQANQWWYNVYDQREEKEKKRKRDQKTLNGQKFRIPTDEELFAATGGKLFGRRAYGSCNGKLKRDEMQLKKSKKHEKDSEEPVTTSSDTNDEEDKEKLRKKAKKTARKLKKKAKKDKRSRCNEPDDG
ncbi:G-patch domain [Phytophthora cactorum]|nr:G-patch domain [Phytophthora cactorum]